MKKNVLMLVLALLGCGAQGVFSQEESKMKPKETEDWSRIPEVVEPGRKTKAPSDAIVLFNGKNLDQWVKTGAENEAAAWKVSGKTMKVVHGVGGIKTKQNFGDCQLHIEWQSPKKDVREGKKGQGCGNSGIFLMDRYEVQVLNNYDNETYYNGMAGSIYKQHIPLVNPAIKAGKWQTYDIIFTAPVFNEDKSLKAPARITVLLNGVLVQNNVALKGPTVYIGHPSYQAHGKAPLQLQNHNNEVKYRNIWIREL